MVECYQRLADSGPVERVKRSYTKTGLWFHVPDDQIDLQVFADKHQLDFNIVSDVLDRQELPHYELNEGIGYVFIRVPTASLLDDSATAPLLAVVKPKAFITLAPGVAFSPRKIEPFLTSSTERPISVLTALIAAVLAEYEQKIRVFEGNIASARRHLHEHEVGNADFIKFVKIEANLNEYYSGLEGA